MTAVSEMVNFLEERRKAGIEEFQRSCLEVWLDEADWIEASNGSRVQVDEWFGREYQRRAEIANGLSHDDYEAIDQQKGWEDGIGTAIAALRELEPGGVS